MVALRDRRGAVSAVASENLDPRGRPDRASARCGAHPERVSPAYLRSDEAYALPRVAGPQRARLLGVGWLRNQRVARIELLPPTTTPAARRLTLVRKLEIVVAVPPAARSSPGPSRSTPSSACTRGCWSTTSRARPGGSGGASRDRRVHGRRAARRRRTRRAVGRRKTATSIYATREWVKLAISEPGLYKVDYGTLRNLRPFRGAVIKNVDLRLYTWRSSLPVLPRRLLRRVRLRRNPDRHAGRRQRHVQRRQPDYFYFFAMGPTTGPTSTTRAEPTPPTSAIRTRPRTTTT